MTTGVMWFRRDLRLLDNPAWNDALSLHDFVVALFVLDARLLATSSRRANRLRSELLCLDAAIAERGGRLRVETGRPDKALSRILVETSAAALHLNLDVTPFATARDALVESQVTEMGTDFRGWWGSLYHRPGDILTSKGTVSQVFTPFSKVWTTTDPNPWPDAGDAALASDPGEWSRADVRPDPDAGESAAHDRLHDFNSKVDDYLDLRDIPGVDGTSQLSTDLRFGTLSPRTVADVIGGHTAGRAGFVRQLAWRDWWAHTLHVRPELTTEPVNPKYRNLQWRNDDDDIKAWKTGTTGYPIVDAGMRELASTGWMHNRVRMIVGSFLVKHLLVDWRIGEAHFRRELLDGDVPQNVGNWQWIAGTGPDAAPYFRIFNPITQSKKFDPNGRYIKQWVPELAGVAARDVHAPWKAAPLDLATADVTLGSDYPFPVVDHSAARERALATYKNAHG
ncbi:MAG: deoxyribodipyrimidine photo-lyase [Candidatus Poriferisodalaceae bacterium]|jgi:deoxyribodipyrimidine photo-lyase